MTAPAASGDIGFGVTPDTPDVDGNADRSVIGGAQTTDERKDLLRRWWLLPLTAVGVDDALAVVSLFAMLIKPALDKAAMFQTRAKAKVHEAASKQSSLEHRRMAQDYMNEMALGVRQRAEVFVQVRGILTDLTSAPKTVANNLTASALFAASQMARSLGPVSVHTGAHGVRTTRHVNADTKVALSVIGNTPDPFISKEQGFLSGAGTQVSWLLTNQMPGITSLDKPRSDLKNGAKHLPLLVAAQIQMLTELAFSPDQFDVVVGRDASNNLAPKLHLQPVAVAAVVAIRAALREQLTDPATMPPLNNLGLTDETYVALEAAEKEAIDYEVSPEHISELANEGDGPRIGGDLPKPPVTQIPTVEFSPDSFGIGLSGIGFGHSN